MGEAVFVLEVPLFPAAFDRQIKGDPGVQERRGSGVWGRGGWAAVQPSPGEGPFTTTGQEEAKSHYVQWEM